MDLKAQDSIGDYEVVHLLGAGGMGQVYKVRNVISDRTEAMKVVLSPATDDGELVDRFVREIKVHASLDHPNIAGIRTAQRAAGQILMILEYIEGQTMEELLRGGPLPVADAMNYAAQVLDALEYAHERGIVHRDIKPANIMITRGGVAKLMDFGVAKGPLASDITTTGRAVGSVSYMSPEQIQGAPGVDARSDLYQVGLLLYECLTGRRPFAGDSDYSIIVARMQENAPSANMLNPNVPRALSQVIAKAMERNPAGRFQSAAAFKTALRNAVSAPVGGQEQLSRVVWLNYAALGFTASMMLTTLAAAVWTLLHAVT